MIHDPHRRRRTARLVLAHSLAWQLGTASATSGIEQSAEEHIDEARARPTPVAQEGNWVVVPVPVANPTIGNGLQVAVLYLHPKEPGDEASPGSTSGLAVMGTDTGARLAGAFHDGSFANDQYRLNAFFGAGEFNLKFYGIGDDPEFAQRPLGYEMLGTLVQVRAAARLPATEHWFAGVTYQFLNATLVFKTSELIPGLPDLPRDFSNAALGPYVVYDSRDSNYFPLTGQHFRAAWLNYSKRWGSDFEFDKGDIFYNHYLPLGTASVLAVRARLQTASEGTPFFALPTLDMRGFSRDRYRDTNTLSLTAEWRHMFAPRWGVVAYGEAGRYASSLQKLADGRTISTVGGGIRWQATADRDMNVGVDVAVSTDDRAVFIQIGERF